MLNIVVALVFIVTITRLYYSALRTDYVIVQSLQTPIVTRVVLGLIMLLYTLLYLALVVIFFSLMDSILTGRKAEYSMVFSSTGISVVY
jgi:hypothetical protein